MYYEGFVRALPHRSSYCPCILILSGQESRLILSDSILKYGKVQNAKLSFHKGDTVTRINDLVSFGQVDVKGYRVILIHARTNDLAELINTPMHALYYSTEIKINHMAHLSLG